MSSIFLVVPGQTREDYNGRDYTYFEFDEYDNIGYFTSREAAQAWVDEQQSEGNEKYQAALKKYPVAFESYKTKKANHNAKQDEIAARAAAANVPYRREQYYPSAPRQPQLSDFVSTEYEIWEVESHNG